MSAMSSFWNWASRSCLRNSHPALDAGSKPLYNRSMKRLAIPILLLICVCSFSFSAQANASLAESDIKAYQSTRHANAKWNNYVVEGIRSFHNGQFDIAQYNLYKAFNLGCQSPIVLFQLALLNEYQRSYYSSLKFYRQAKAQFQKSNTGHRYHKEYNENYGRALYDSGKEKEAMPLLKKAAKRSKSFWLLKLVGMIAYDQGDTLNATSYFERAVRIQSSDVTPDQLVFIYTLLGRIFINKGQKDGAYRYYQKVLEFDPGNAEANYVVQGIQKSYQRDRNKELIETLQNY